MNDFFSHHTAVIDEGCIIGAGTKIWHFSHVMSGCVIGENCNLGQNVVVFPSTYWNDALSFLSAQLISDNTINICKLENRKNTMSLLRIIKQVGYGFLDFITCHKGIIVNINDFHLKLPAKYVRFFPKNYEESSFKFAKQNIKEGDVILDIGAHIGLYSIFIAKVLKGTVYSFEPTHANRKILKKVIKINNCEKAITIVPVAISDRDGSAIFFSNNVDASVSNSLVEVDFKDGNTRTGAYSVDITSIDNFRRLNNIKINFLKIDAEGVEVEALLGARETFINDRPAAVLGLHPFAYDNVSKTLEKIWDILTEYQLNVCIEGSPIEKENFCAITQRVFDVELLPKWN